MTDRRQFMHTLGAGALGALTLAAAGRAQMAPGPPDKGTGKKVRVGIIGAENSHTIGIGRTFNEQKVFPGVEVVAVWGETDEFARNAAEKGSIPKIVKQQSELMGQIDALMIDHRHARYHVDAAIPFVEAGIPTFVDKPFCYRVRNGLKLIEIAEAKGTPITSLSGVGYGPEVDDLVAQVASIDPADIHSVVVTGPSDITSKYGGIFFYAIHTVERMMKVFGSDVEAARATRNAGRFTFQFKYAGGQIVTYVPVRGWDIYLGMRDGLKQIKPRIEVENGTHYMYSAIIKMFQTGEEPRTHESLIPPIAALEAMERSVHSEDWEMLLIGG
jgi:predicted dehydrogenase